MNIWALELAIEKYIDHFPNLDAPIMDWGKAIYRLDKENTLLASMLCEELQKFDGIIQYDGEKVRVEYNIRSTDKQDLDHLLLDYARRIGPQEKHRISKILNFVSSDAIKQLIKEYE